VFPFGVLPRVWSARHREYVRRASYATQFVARAPAARLDTPLDAEVTDLVDGAIVDLPGGVRLRGAVVPHVPELEAMAYRVEINGRSVVYSGDTQAVPWTLVPFSEGADMLIHEAFSEAGLDDWLAGVDPVRAEPVRAAFRGTHTDVREAARIAKEAGVQRLILTHLNPGEKPERLAREAGAIFAGEILVAEDGMALDL
jgi:ribonuclease BN (tRNA processing enzyme)